MKKTFLCILVELVLFAIVAKYLTGYEIKDTPIDLTAQHVREQFVSSNDLFQKCAKILWDRRTYFEHMFDDTGYMRITSHSAADHELYFSDEEWQNIRELFDKYHVKYMKNIISSLPFNSYSARAIEFFFVVQPEDQHGSGYSLYYVNPYEGIRHWDVASSIEMLIHYIGQYGTLSKLSYDNWYEWRAAPEKEE